jgi:predicted phage-related endonuclease
MQPDAVELRKPIERRSFLGGSDARVIMGSDEPALLRLWREKRGEAEPPDYSGNSGTSARLARSSKMFKVGSATR